MTDGTMHYEHLIAEVVSKIYANAPELADRYGEQGIMKCKEDNLHHMKHLHTASALRNSQLFIDYAVWLNGILVIHGMQTRHLTDNFRYISESLYLLEDLDEPTLNFYRYCLIAAMDQLEPDME